MPQFNPSTFHVSICHMILFLHNVEKYEKVGERIRNIEESIDIESEMTRRIPFHRFNVSFPPEFSMYIVSSHCSTVHYESQLNRAKASLTRPKILKNQNESQIRLTSDLILEFKNWRLLVRYDFMNIVLLDKT